MSLPEDTYDDTQSDAGPNAGAMSIQQWEAFRIRTVALEQAVAWVSVWDSAMTSDVLEVADEFEAFLRGEEDGNGTEP